MFDFRINQLWIIYESSSNNDSGIGEMGFFPCWYITKLNGSVQNSYYSYYWVSAVQGNYWYCYSQNKMCLQENGKKILWAYSDSSNAAAFQFNSENITYYYMGF